MPVDLKKTQLRAIQYWYIDGSFEFSFGGLCLLLGAYFYAQAAIPETSVSALLNVGFIVIVPVGAFLVNRLTGKLKQRITYPRMGYLAYKHPPGGWRRGLRMGGTLLLAGITGGIVAALVTHNPKIINWMPGMTAAIFALVLGLLGHRSALPRFYFLAILSLLGGLGLSWYHIGDIPGLAVYYIFSGLLLLFSGGLTLWQYLRHNPIQPEAADEQ